MSQGSLSSDGIAASSIAGAIAAVLLVGLLGGWATTAELAGAVLAPGTVVVESNVKKVQHPSGGVVGEIRVRDGDRVENGDLLVRLDETLTQANLLIVTRQLDELGVRAARLRAERDGAETVTLSAELARRAADPEIELIFVGERTLFESRRTARLGQKAQLSERKAQLGQEIAGLERQLKAKLRELNLIATELQGLEFLFQRNLVSLTKYTATQREAARLGGEEGQIVAGIAQAKGRIGEIDLQIIQIDQDLRTEVIKELRDMEAKQAELNERRIAAEDSRKRIDIRAPMSGIVHQLTVHTVGGVVNAGEPLMLIVPQSDALVIEVKVSPQDIDQLHVSQAAKVRLVAFNQRTTPELDGAVAHVSADLTTNTDTGQTYYIARITIPDHELQRIAPLRLRPGMPAEIHIGTGSRTALSYLMKPLQDQFARTFKER